MYKHNHNGDNMDIHNCISRGENIMLKSKYNYKNIISYFQCKRFSKNRICPHCSCNHTVKYGKSKGNQRYKCKVCKRTFSDLTNTPLYRTHHPEKWEAFIKYTINGLSLRAAASQVKLSYVTLFYWRHKLLDPLKRVKQNKMEGSFEVENFFLKFSQKGKKQIEHNEKRVHDQSLSHFHIDSGKVCVLTALDLHENIYSMAVCKGRMHTSEINDFIGKLLNNNTVACSRPKSFFAMFFRRMHIEEERRPLDNNSMVIKYRIHCVKWLYRFRGVATKYVNNYLSLFKFLKKINFCENSWAVKKFITAVGSINIENTYMSIRNGEVCFN